MTEQSEQTEQPTKGTDTPAAPPVAQPDVQPDLTPGFHGDVAVREQGDQGWVLIEPLLYRGKTETFTVEPGFVTDFASVPRIFTWLLPRYGRYTKAAILHDYLCDNAKAGKTPLRWEADAIFRRAMREEGVSFLKRWLMWAAVRLGSVGDAGLAQLFRPSAASFISWLVLAIGAIGFLVVPDLVIMVALVVFFLLEVVAFLLVKVFHRKATAERPEKAINVPRLTWRV